MTDSKVKDMQRMVDNATFYLDSKNSKIDKSDLNIHRLAYMLKEIVSFWDKFTRAIVINLKHGGIVTPGFRRALLKGIKQYRKMLLLDGKRFKVDVTPDFKDLPKKTARLLAAAHRFQRKVKDEDVNSGAEIAIAFTLMMAESIRFYHGSVLHRRPVKVLRHAEKTALDRIHEAA